MTRSRARMTFACGSIVAIAVAVILLWPRAPAVRVLDPRMRVMSARLLTGTNESFYAGNQLEGRARALLKRMGLPIETLPDVGKAPSRFIGPTEACRFAIYFKWTGASDLVNVGPVALDERRFVEVGIGAELINESGTIRTVEPTMLVRFQPMKDYYMCVAELDQELLSRGDCLLRLASYQRGNGWPESTNSNTTSNCLAEIVIKRMPLNQVRSR